MPPRRHSQPSCRRYEQSGSALVDDRCPSKGGDGSVEGFALVAVGTAVGEQKVAQGSVRRRIARVPTYKRQRGRKVQSTTFTDTHHSTNRASQTCVLHAQMPPVTFPWRPSISPPVNKQSRQDHPRAPATAAKIGPGRQAREKESSVRG